MTSWRSAKPTASMICSDYLLSSGTITWSLLTSALISTQSRWCGYAVGHYLEHSDLNSVKKFIAIKDKHIILHEQNAFTSHLMHEIYNLTKRSLDAAQIAAIKRIHPNLVLVKLLELYRMGYDLRHYYDQHHAFIECFHLPAHFRFDAPQAV